MPCLFHHASPLSSFSLIRVKTLAKSLLVFLICIGLVRPGRILYEFSGVPEEVAEEAHRLVDAKLPIKTRLVKAGGIKT